MNIVDFRKHAPRGFQNTLAGRGDPVQMLAVALEDQKPQLLLEQPDLLAYARLRGMQDPGGRRDIELLPSDFVDVFELTEFHGFLD